MHSYIRICAKLDCSRSFSTITHNRVFCYKCAPDGSYVGERFENCEGKTDPDPMVAVEEIKRAPTHQTFDTGATRDLSDDKVDYQYIDPRFLAAFVEYGKTCSLMPDGSHRTIDNWKKGMPVLGYFKSMLRHVMALWLVGENPIKDDDLAREGEFEAAMGMLFNLQGFVTRRMEEFPNWLEIGIIHHRLRRERELKARAQAAAGAEIKRMVRDLASNK